MKTVAKVMSEYNFYLLYFSVDIQLADFFFLLL